MVSPCPPCHFSGKSRPGISKGVGSVHPDLAPLACGLYCPKGRTLRRDPISALPVLKCLIFLEQWVPNFCVPHFHFSLAPTNWVAGPGLPVEFYRRSKDIHHPSPSFLIKFISKQYLFLQLVSCFLPLAFLSTHSPRPCYWS